MRLVASWLYTMAGFISLHFWGRMSARFHIATSAFLARIYDYGISRLFILPYCFWHFKDPFYYRNFRPGQGGEKFRSFQDFFTRDLVEYPQFDPDGIWPCEGFLCEKGRVRNISSVNVKGDVRLLKTIFGKFGPQISDQDYFSNVFLHNKNYHHIHAPTDGEITGYEYIPGQLLLLRPWAYKRNPSLPALTNERVNLEITDKKQRKWYLSIVGGPLVATVDLSSEVYVGSSVNIGQKIASFRLGSTCCMVSPVAPRAEVNALVSMGDSLQSQEVSRSKEPISFSA